MSEWPTQRLGDLFSIEKGRIGIRAATAGSYPLVTTGERHSSHYESHFTGDALCIPLVSATGHGHASIKRLHHIQGEFAVGSILCACVSKDPERVSARYAYYYLSACKEEVLIPLMQGSANVTLKLSDIVDVQIPLPPLAEQQALVARIDALADKTRELTEHLYRIDTAADALVLSTHHSLAKRRSVALSEIIELHEKPQPVMAGEEYPQVGIRSFGGGLFAKGAVTAADTTYRAFNTLYPGAIVLSQVKGWEGAIALTPSNLVGKFASPEYRTFRCIDGQASPDYLAELFKTPWFWSLLHEATRGVGARRERTRPEQFLNVKLPMPALDQQLNAVEVFARLSALETRHAEIRTANTALLPSTLERLFAIPSAST